MEPIVFVHGFSAEGSGEPSGTTVEQIYGTLPSVLRQPGVLGPDADVVHVNVSRYVSLDDRVSVEDITLAFDRVLRTQFPELLGTGFNAIVHSTGALVLRNWVRRCSKRPSPLKRLIHLAGANFGSGWAHIGESLLVKWLKYIGQEGAQRGLAVLDSLELGSNWTIELHRHFLRNGYLMVEDYQVMEFCIIGTQVPAEWMLVPVRYGKEDGSDGVVRVSGCNLNHHYLRIGPKMAGNVLDWTKASGFAATVTTPAGTSGSAGFRANSAFAGNYYEIKEDCRPEGVQAGPNSKLRTRAVVPFAIPYQTAHSNETIGIVTGLETQEEVLGLIASALRCETPEQYGQQVQRFDDVTQATYVRVRDRRHGRSIRERISAAALDLFFNNPEGQYDRHAQVIVRVVDQHGRPVSDYEIHFNSFGGGAQPRELIDSLFEDKHKNNNSLNTITFYLRTDCFDEETRDWTARIPKIMGVDLEIDVIDAQTNRIMFVPLRMRIPPEELQQWIQPHRTTIIDIELLRLPSTEVFMMF